MKNITIDDLTHMAIKRWCDFRQQSIPEVINHLVALGLRTEDDYYERPDRQCKQRDYDRICRAMSRTT